MGTYAFNNGVLFYDRNEMSSSEFLAFRVFIDAKEGKRRLET